MASASGGASTSASEGELILSKDEAELLALVKEKLSGPASEGSHVLKGEGISKGLDVVPLGDLNPKIRMYSYFRFDTDMKLSERRIGRTQRALGPHLDPDRSCDSNDRHR